MAGLVGSDAQDQITQSCSFIERVVIPALDGGLNFGPFMQDTVWGINIEKHSRISFDCLLFQIAYEPVCEFRTEQIGDKQEIEESSLHGQNIKPFEKSWFLQFQEYEQVKSFVICFLEEMVDPPFIPSKISDAFQVPSHSTHHAGHTRHGFQQNAPLNPFGHRHFLPILGSQEIIGPPDGPDAFVGELIPNRLGFKMLYLYLLCFTFRVDVVNHPMVSRVINPLPLGQRVKQRFNSLHQIIERSANIRRYINISKRFVVQGSYKIQTTSAAETQDKLR